LFHHVLRLSKDSLERTGATLGVTLGLAAHLGGNWTMAFTELEIRAAKAVEKPLKLFDGGGLYLLVTPGGGR